MAALRQYFDRVGHTRVPARHVEVFDGEDIYLGRWADHKRVVFKKGELPARWIADLEALPGWVWVSGFEADHQRNLAALHQFVDRVGHARVVRGHVEVFDGEDIKLDMWVVDRRVVFKKGKLSAEWIAELEALPGWEWDARWGLSVDLGRLGAFW